MYESSKLWVSVRTRGVGGQLDGKRGKLGFGVGRPVSLMLRADSLSVHDLRRLLERWVYALSFRRETLSTLDVAFVAVESCPPRRRCAIEGALLDERLVSTFLPSLGR